MTKKKKTNKEEENTEVDQTTQDNPVLENDSNNEESSDQNTACEDDKDNLAAQLAELKDKHLRLFSEFDNYRKRTAKERIDLFKTAHSDLILDLLPVIDDFDRAKKSFEDTNDIDTIKQGVELIQNKLYSTLERKGLKCMESLEKDFDTDFHEAITEIPAPSKKLKSKVVDVVEKGYLLNDKVIRYAKVVVGK
ncbi:MAG: nucleotide exchange factor GrpE [Bacteroidales bacterium]|nr:nucleotide exchange factor GrpE [Bacteroidales bacterium]